MTQHITKVTFAIYFDHEPTEEDLTNIGWWEENSHQTARSATRGVTRVVTSSTSVTSHADDAPDVAT